MTGPELGREPYVNLATFRKSGKEVWTPVWIPNRRQILR